MKTLKDHKLFQELVENPCWETLFDADFCPKNPHIPILSGGLDRISKTKKYFTFHDIGCNGRDNSFRCVYICSHEDIDMYLASAVSQYDWLQNAGTEIIFMRNGSIADIDITTLKDIGNGAFLAKRLSDGVTIKCYKVVRIAQ